MSQFPKPPIAAKGGEVAPIGTAVASITEMSLMNLINRHESVLIDPNMARTHPLIGFGIQDRDRREFTSAEDRHRDELLGNPPVQCDIHSVASLPAESRIMRRIR